MNFMFRLQTDPKLYHHVYTNILKSKRIRNSKPLLVSSIWDKCTLKCPVHSVKEACPQEDFSRVQDMVAFHSLSDGQKGHRQPQLAHTPCVAGEHTVLVMLASICGKKKKYPP